MFFSHFFRTYERGSTVDPDATTVISDSCSVIGRGEKRLFCYLICEVNLSPHVRESCTSEASIYILKNREIIFLSFRCTELETFVAFNIKNWSMGFREQIALSRPLILFLQKL